MECDLETLSESIDFKSAIKGAKLNLKTNKGLIATLIRAGKDVSLLFWHSLKVLGGNEESRKKVKELARKKVSKEDFMNFLINLDMITFHAISGPIHIIDAITGWDLHHKIISTHDKIKEILFSAKAPTTRIANPKNKDKNNGINIRAKGIKSLNISSCVKDLEIQ